MSFGSNLMKVPGNPLASIIGGVGTQFLGDYMAQKEDRKQAEENREAVEKANKFNYDMQKEFAQHSLRWRIEDAAAAGIHPLAALGAQSYQASPSAVGYQDTSDRGALYRDVGQNISRAISATQTHEERLASRLRLESMQLDNQLKQKELLRQDNVGPAMPSLQHDPYLQGQGDTPKAFNQNDGRVIDMPFRRTVSDPNNPAKEAGAIPDFQVARTVGSSGKGGYAIVPAQDMKNRIEDSPMEYQWLIRNTLRLYKHPEGGYALMNPLTGNLMKIPFTNRRRK